MSPSPRSNQFSMPTSCLSLGTEAEREGEMIFEYHPEQCRQKQSQTKTVSGGGCDPLYIPSPERLPSLSASLSASLPCVGLASPLGIQGPLLLLYEYTSTGESLLCSAAISPWPIYSQSAHEQWFFYNKKNPTKSLTIRCYLCIPVAACRVSPLDVVHLFWSENLMSTCAPCGLRAEEGCGVLSNGTAQQNKLHSAFHAEPSWLDSLRASTKITLVTLIQCIVGYVLCVCLG